MTKQAKLDFCELLANDSLDVIEAFSSQVLLQADRARTQVLCQALSDFFEAQGRSLKLIHWSIHEEVEISKADGSVFRGTSVATLLMNVFFKHVGLEYLKHTISSAVQDICSCNCTFEVSPEKCPTEELKTNVLKIFSVAQRLLNSIIEKIDDCPVPIRVTLNMLKREVAKKFPSLQGVVVGSFLFLRFFCPAIVSPEELNIMPSPPSQTARRGLILVSKLLQNLANGLEFGNKEPAMASFNPFITDNKSKVDAFFNILADVSVNLPEAVHTHLRTLNGQKVRSQSTSHFDTNEVNAKKGKKKRGRSKSMEEQQRNKITSSSPNTSLDFNDTTNDSSVNDVIYEDEEDSNSEEDEVHGPTTSESEPLELNRRRIISKKSKRFTNVSEDVLSQFIYNYNFERHDSKIFRITNLSLQNTKLALFQVSVARFEEVFNIILHCVRQNIDSMCDYLQVKDRVETIDKLKEVLLVLDGTRDRSNSAIEERLKEHEKLYLQSQYFMGTASPQRNLSPIQQKAAKVVKKSSFKKEVKITAVKSGDIEKSKSPRDRRDSSPPRKLSLFSSNSEEKPDKDNRRKSDRRKSSTRPSDSSLLRNELNSLKEEMQRVTASNLELQKVNMQLRVRLEHQEQPVYRPPSNVTLNEELKGLLFEQIRDSMFGDLKTFVVSEIKRYLLSSVKDDIMKMMQTLQSKAMSDMSLMLEQVTNPPLLSNFNDLNSSRVNSAEISELKNQVESLQMTIEKLEKEVSLHVTVNSQLAKEIKTLRLDSAEEKIKVRTMEQQIAQIIKSQEELQLNQMRTRPSTPTPQAKSIGSIATITANTNVPASSGSTVQFMVLAPNSEYDGQQLGTTSHVILPGQEIPLSANDSAIIITRSRANSQSVQPNPNNGATSSVVIPNTDSTIIIRSRANSLSIQTNNNNANNTSTNNNNAVQNNTRNNNNSSPYMYNDITEEEPDVPAGSEMVKTAQSQLKIEVPIDSNTDTSYSASEPAPSRVSADPVKPPTQSSTNSIVIPQQPPSHDSIVTGSESRNNSSTEKDSKRKKDSPSKTKLSTVEESSFSSSKKENKDKKKKVSSPKKEKKEKQKRDKKNSGSGSFLNLKKKKDKK